MADRELRYRKGPGPIAKVFGSIGIAALVHSLEDQELDAPDPKVVSWTPRSSALRQLAVELVGAGRFDRDAAQTLAAAAGRHTRELTRAAAAVRQGGWTEEDETSFRVDRLLAAAATGRDPVPPDAGQAAWFRQVADLVALPPGEAFAVLAAEEPALEEFARDVARTTGTPEFADGDEERRAGILSAVLDPGLAGIVRDTSSRLLRTRAGWFVARDHACSTMGLAAPDGYAPPNRVPGD